MDQNETQEDCVNPITRQSLVDMVEDFQDAYNAIGDAEKHCAFIFWIAETIDDYVDCCEQNVANAVLQKERFALACLKQIDFERIKFELSLAKEAAKRISEEIEQEAQR